MTQWLHAHISKNVEKDQIVKHTLADEPTKNCSLCFVAGCQYNWTGYRNVCYTMNTTRKLSWLDARYDCIKKGGEIVRITEKDVNEFILETFRESSGEHIWIGLTRCSFNTTKWCYPDGIVTGYTNWEKMNKEPNNQLGIENCTEMYHDGTWNDYPCYLRRPYVCQMPCMSLIQCILTNFLLQDSKTIKNMVNHQNFRDTCVFFCTHFQSTWFSRQKRE